MSSEENVTRMCKVGFSFNKSKIERWIEEGVIQSLCKNNFKLQFLGSGRLMYLPRETQL